MDYSDNFYSVIDIRCSAKTEPLVFTLSKYSIKYSRTLQFVLSRCCEQGYDMQLQNQT